MYKKKNLDMTRYRGLSTDTKPNAAIGSTFHEMDTGVVYMYDGDAWNEMPDQKVKEKTAGPAAIASFTTSLRKRLKSLLVTMEPIQDLHGQANPYPAGGGKNLLNAQTRNATTVNGITSQVYANNRITISGTATASGDCVVDITPISISAGESITISWTGRDTRSATIAVFLHDGSSFYTYKSANANVHFVTFDITDAKTIGELLFRTYIGSTIDFDCNVQIEKGTTATSYAPYSNICPISGRQSVTVTRAGKNLLNPDLMEIGSYGTIGGDIETGNPAYRRFAIRLPAGTYTFSTTLTNAYLIRYLIDDVQNYIRYKGQSYTITLSNAAELKLTFRNTSSTAITEDFTCQLELGSTATAHEPYDGKSVTVQLGQTVYGGTVDVVTGEMVVDRAMVTYDGSENWYAVAISGGVKYRNALDSLPNGIKTVTDNSEVPDVVTNLFPAISSYASWRGINGISMQTTYGWRIYFDAFNTSDIALWKAYLAEHPLTVAYKLVTPVTVQLTAQQISALKGTNNVWSDAGNVTVTYFDKK